jgi:hypothetical protein
MSTRVFLSALLLLAAAAPAAAQVMTTVDLTFPNLAAPIPPGTSQRFNVTVRYQYSEGFSPQPTTVRLETVDQPSWLQSTFEPAEFEVRQSSTPAGIFIGRGVHVRLVNLTLAVAPDAPAFEDATANYRVVAAPNPPFDGAERVRPLALTAGFSGAIAAALPNGETVNAWGGFETHVPLRIENRGNGPLLVAVEIVRFPAESLVIGPVDPVRVGAAAGERVTTVDLVVLVPWKVSEKGPVEVELTPTHATQGTPARRVEVAFQLDGKSAFPVPDIGTFAVVAMAVGAVLLRRRRD